MGRNLNEKVVLITGAGGGLGRGIAKAFAKEGANLALTDIALNNLTSIKEELETECGIKVLIFEADGSKEDDVREVVSAVASQFGRIDTVINNAQASKSGTLLADHSREDFALAINTGLYATFFYMREAFPYLKESKGSVINFASGAGFKGQPGQASYAAAKEGIRGLSRVAATEWGEFGVRVNVVCPLAMTPHLERWKEEYPDIYNKTITNIPLNRFADPEAEVGRTCVFLASDDAGFISGETISIQGGSGLRP